MMKALAAAVVMVCVVALALGARAGEGERRELWMYSAPASADDDDIADASYVGLMVSEPVCLGLAEAMTAYMRTDQSKVAAAFQCQAPRLPPVEQN